MPILHDKILSYNRMKMNSVYPLEIKRNSSQKAIFTEEVRHHCAYRSDFQFPVKDKVLVNKIAAYEASKWSLCTRHFVSWRLFHDVMPRPQKLLLKAIQF